MQVGLLSLLGLPYAYRFLLAPLIDHYSLGGWGRRRGWMMLTQGMLLLGFNFIAWMSPTTSFGFLVGMAAVLSLFSALQDSVIDAQRIEYLSEQDYGLGASLATFGYRLSLLVGGGVTLLFAYHHGWAMTYRLMGCGMGIGWLAAWWSEEPASQPLPAPGVLTASAWTDPIREFLSRPYWLSALGLIFFFKLGEVFTSTLSGCVIPFLVQGLGISLKTIGYINQVVGVLALVLGGMLAGVWLKFTPLFQVLLYCGLLQIAAIVLFLGLACVGYVPWLFGMAVFVDNWVVGMGSTVMVVLLMQLVNRQFTATQFSLLVAVSALPRVLSGPLAAWLHASVGWVGVYEWAFGLSWLFIPFWWRLRGALPMMAAREACICP